MANVTTRCTQCGAVEKNRPVKREHTRHGDGRSHGVERLACYECSDSCSRTECDDRSPCENCRVLTVQNRCGNSVPAPDTR